MQTLASPVMSGRDFTHAEVMSVVADVVSTLKRQAHAAEELVEIAKQEQVTIQPEPGPPICVVCGHVDPQISVHEQGGTGSLMEFVIEMEMQCCNARVYAIPEGWLMTTERQEALAFVKERAGANGGSNDGRSNQYSERSDQGTEPDQEDEAGSGGS